MNAALGIIKQFTCWLENHELVSQDPFARFKLGKNKSEKQPSPSPEVANEIIKLLPAHYYVPSLLLSYSGLRSGEGRNLLIDDVDLKTWWIHVVSRPGAETKNRQSRKVPIHPNLRIILKDYQPSHGTHFFKMPASRQNPRGTNLLNKNRFNDAFVKSVKQLGLVAGRKARGFVVHSLRHLFETSCVNAGIPQFVIDTWMGHCSGKSIGRVYYQLADDKSQEFMAKVPLALGLDRLTNQVQH